MKINFNRVFYIITITKKKNNSKNKTEITSETLLLIWGILLLLEVTGEYKLAQNNIK